jgi:hypothetical protein
MTFYSFDRHVLRTIPKPLRRRWLQERYRYAEPRVAISRLYGIYGLHKSYDRM